jgi:ssDNA-binding Zn-finger/Zn-ribbon topoisomerase 1
MLQRTARKGSKTGQAFWGCSGYPDCKGTLKLNLSDKSDQSDRSDKRPKKTP